MTQPRTDDDIRLAIQISGIIFAFCVVLNVGFYFLSGVYYDDKIASQGLLSTITPATVRGTRFTFALFSGGVTLAMIATLFAPKYVAHALTGVAALSAMIAGVFAFNAAMPGALWMALMVIGLSMPFMIWRSLVGSRGAWAFLTSLCFVLALVLLFGAPKVRAQISIGLWTAMLIPGLLAVAGVGLTMTRRDYGDPRRHGVLQPK